MKPETPGGQVRIWILSSPRIRLEEGLEFEFEAFEGEADDIGAGAEDAADDEMAVFLEGVAAGFVEGVDLVEVMADGGEGELAELDVGDVGEGAAAVFAEVEEADAGGDGVLAALEGREHGFSFLARGGLAEAARAEVDERVGAEDEGVGVAFGDGAGFAVGVDLAEFGGGEVIVIEFVGGAGDGLEGQAEALEEFAAPGRDGGEDERDGEDEVGGVGVG